MSHTQPKPLKCLFIGVDGATDDVIGPMVEAGRLPTFARLRRGGAYGRMQSQPGYSSPALWCTIESGYPPEEHGVLGFPTALRSNLRRLRLHERLAKAGWKIGMCRMFCNWPPGKNEAFVVPSFAGVAGKAKPAWVEPLCKAKVLSAMSDKARFLWSCAKARIGLRPLINVLKAGANSHRVERENSKAYFHLQNAQHWLYARLFRRLVRTHQPDYAALMIGIADSIGHRYWRYHEMRRRGERHRACRRFGDLVERAYAEIDRAVGELLTLTDDRTTVVIASDHGMEYVEREGANLVVASALPKLLDLDSQVEAYFAGYIAYLGVPTGGPALDDLLAKVKRTRLTSPEQRLFDPCHISGKRIRLGIARDVAYEPDRPVRVWNGRVIRLRDLARREPRRPGDHGHGPDGILLLRGPGIRRGATIRDATHYHVAPTALALLGMPIPGGLRGEPLADVLQPECVADIVYTEDETASPATPSETLTAEQEATLEDRLRDLGYID